MRLIKRIIYALLVSFGMFVVYSITDSHYRLKKINELGNKAIENNDIEFFVGAKFYNKEPIYEEKVTSNHRTYDIYIYDSGVFIRDDKNIKSISGLNVIIHQTSGTLLPERLYAKVFDNQENSLSYTFVRIGNLPIYTIIDFDNKNLPIVIFNKFEKEVSIEITKISIAFSQDGAVILSLDNLDIKEDNMLVSKELNEYYETNKKIPEENFGFITLNKDNLKLDNYLSWLWMFSYLILILFITWLYNYYKKHLKKGKRIISPGLEKDIRKFKNKK